LALRPDCPALAKGTRVVRQVEDGRPRWIVRAGSSGKYLRVGEAEAEILGLLDGKRTVAEVRTAFVARRRERLDAGELATFLADMRRKQVVEETETAKNLLLLEKARQKRKERLFGGGVGSLLFLRVKLLDPDRFLTAIEPGTRWIFTRGFVAAGALLVLAAAAVLAARWGEIVGHLRDFGFLAGGGGIFALWATALGVVAVHETAHGVACKHWGGEVREMGFLLLFFQPCFYCNVNDAWTFESRAARLWVTAAGGVAEVVLGAACVLLWAASEPGTGLHEGARRVFMISLSLTLLVNMNPLIKLDGYYLLADFLKVENLRERSFRHLGNLGKRLIGRPAPAETADPRESRILLVYGAASTVYMTLLAATLLTVLAGAILGDASPGPFQLALVATIAWLILKKPLRAAGGAVGDLVRTGTARYGARRLWGSCGAGAAGIALASCVVPWTRTAGGGAAAEPVAAAELRAPLEGTVREVLAAEGARVAAGDPVFRVEAPVEEAAARVEREGAGRLRRDALRRRAAGDAPGAAAASAEAEAAELRAREVEERLERLTVRSPLDGVVLTRRTEDLRGLPVRREDPVIRVGDLSRIRFRACLDGGAVTRVREGMEAVVRLRAFPGEEIGARVVSVGRSPRGEDAAAGTGATAAAGPKGDPTWDVLVEAPNPGGRIRPGMSGEVRILYERTTAAGALLSGIGETFRRDLLR
jgi:putative peptide zinc metalloprotease protein